MSVDVSWITRNVIQYDDDYYYDDAGAEMLIFVLDSTWLLASCQYCFRFCFFGWEEEIFLIGVVSKLKGIYFMIPKVDEIAHNTISSYYLKTISPRNFLWMTSYKSHIFRYKYRKWISKKNKQHTTQNKEILRKNFNVSTHMYEINLNF